MAMTFGSPVTEKDGFTIHRLYVKNALGGYDVIGFGVFSPDGELYSFFATQAEAEEALDDVTEPRPPRAGLG